MRGEYEAISLKDACYPALLKKVEHPPKVLYVKGDSEIFAEPAFAIVGTRKASGQGMELAQEIASRLASAGLVIVSGLAQGIDGASHQGALESRGKTIGVLGSSLEERFFFPRKNLLLAKEMIAKGGAVVSEYEKNQPAFRQNFVARNRIIAGLSRGVLVVEAPIKSGALITAQFAREVKRPVFALPGSPFAKTFEGTNWLIKTGAYLVENAKDILEILAKKKLFTPKRVTVTLTNSVWVWQDMSEEERKILGALEKGQAHIDKLVQTTKVETSMLLSLLIGLELKGVVKNVGGGNYIIVKSYEIGKTG